MCSGVWLCFIVCGSVCSIVRLCVIVYGSVW